MYIVFEGVDNTGKSTQIELVSERISLILKRKGLDVPVLKIAEEEIDKNTVHNPDDGGEMALRYALQRRILLKDYSDELCYNNPSILLSDRSYYSSMAYQGEWVKQLNEFVPKPNLIFFFDRGEPEDEGLKYVYNNYFNVLPLSTIHVNTKKHSIVSTTDYITRKILEKWNKLFNDNE